MKAVDFCPQGLEMVLLGPRAPRRALQGSAVFAVAVQGGRAMPTSLRPPAPLLHLAGFKSIIVSPPDQVHQVMHQLADPGFASILCRPPSRGPGSSQALPRVKRSRIVFVLAPWARPRDEWSCVAT